MLKNALIFEKTAKFAAVLGVPPSDPPVVIPITCYTNFLKAFVALTSLLSKRNKNSLEIAIIFSFAPHFLF